MADAHLCGWDNAARLTIIVLKPRAAHWQTIRDHLLTMIKQRDFSSSKSHCIWFNMWSIYLFSLQVTFLLSISLLFRTDKRNIVHVYFTFCQCILNIASKNSRYSETVTFHYFWSGKYLLRRIVRSTLGVVSSMRLTSYFHHEWIFPIRFNSSSAKFSAKNYAFYPYNLFYREIIRP